jgi:acetylornithine deacetylase/succinyl-diaminopimelate desuccinylase-like protein
VLETGQPKADMNAILHTPPDQAALGRLSQDPRYNSILRTTCIATRFDAGHANNALPQTAKANVNCRILPGHSAEEVRQTLIKIFADKKISVRFAAIGGDFVEPAPAALASRAVTLRPDVVKATEQVSAAMWPGAPVIPFMDTGASDSIYTNAAGMPSYGVSGLAIDQDDVRAHGKDERIRVSSYYEGVEFFHSYFKALVAIH